MTALQELQKRLSEMSERQREAAATRFLLELETQEQSTKSVQGERSHPLPGVKQVPFERIKHLAGIFEGPGDLTTNPKYMDDFGKSSMR